MAESRQPGLASSAAGLQDGEPDGDGRHPLLAALGERVRNLRARSAA